MTRNSGGVDELLDLPEYLRAQRVRINDRLEQIARAYVQGDAVVTNALRYALRGEGKRLRPIFCLAAYEAGSSPEQRSRRPPGRAGEDDLRRERNVPNAGENVVDIACALELIHAYSLIHDDLPCMDNAPTRRARPTTHVVFSSRAALLAGAALIPLAFRILDRGARALPLTSAQRRDLARTLARAAGSEGMVGGQALDLEAETRTVSLRELEHIHALKTGALLTAAVMLGGISAGLGGGELAALHTYGAGVGMAFQIADDLLDVTGGAGALGKAAGRDQELGKATFPALLGLAGARERAEFEARSAVAALSDVGLATPALRALAQYAVDRDR